MFNKLFDKLRRLFNTTSAEDARHVSLYMKDVVKKREEKERKKRLKYAKSLIEGEIARAALNGEDDCTIRGIDEDIAESLTQWSASLGYKVLYIDGNYGKRYYISWGDNNAD